MRLSALASAALFAGCATSNLFHAGPTLRVSRAPLVTAAVDLNGDGKLDVVALSGAAGGVATVLLGRGDGSFSEGATYSVGPTPIGVVFGDFNVDHKIDAAIVARGEIVEGSHVGGRVSVLLGQGDGSFRAPIAYAGGGSPASIAAGDLNGDDKLDLVVGNYGPGVNVGVLLGAGDGSFSAAALGRWGDRVNRVASVALGDFNGDGKLDLAASDEDTAMVGVRPGAGDGSFGEAIEFNAGFGGSVLLARDFDNDGKLDLAIAHTGVALFRGAGNGRFTLASEYPVGTGFISISSADLNGDGKLDLVATGRGDARDHEWIGGTVWALLGDGRGHFRAEEIAQKTRGPQAVAVGDFDGDGKVDLAVAGQSSSNLAVLLSRR